MHIGRRILSIISAARKMRSGKRAAVLAGVGVTFAAILAFSGTSALAAQTGGTAASGHIATPHSVGAENMLTFTSAGFTLSPRAAQPNLVGQGGHVKFDRATLFQCPNANICNKGGAEAADDVAGICFLPGTIGFRGTGPWVLVLDHANNVAGFIASDFWTPNVLPTIVSAC